MPIFSFRSDSDSDYIHFLKWMQNASIIQGGFVGKNKCFVNDIWCWFWERVHTISPLCNTHEEKTKSKKTLLLWNFIRFSLWPSSGFSRGLLWKHDTVTVIKWIQEGKQVLYQMFYVTNTLRNILTNRSTACYSCMFGFTTVINNMNFEQ